MIPIRNAQMTVLADEVRRTLIDKYIRLLRQKYPDRLAPASDQDLRSSCNLGIDQALHWGLQTEFNIFIYLSAMHLLGPDFVSGETQEILADNKMEEDLKAGLLRLRILNDTGVDVAHV